jgi:hypothetical protein
MKKWNLLFTIGCGLIVAACSVGGSGSSEETCADFNAAIDRNIVEIAVSMSDGETSDKSAVQQGARLAEVNNRLSTIAINVLLQAQNKCQPRQKPIDPSIYRSQASSCHMARIRQYLASDKGSDVEKSTAKAKVASDCDFKAWNLQIQK